MLKQEEPPLVNTVTNPSAKLIRLHCVWFTTVSRPYVPFLVLFYQHESESCSVVSDSLWPHELYSLWNFPGQNTGVGSLSLLQGIFPSQGLNLGLPHCGRILYQLSHQGSPTKEEDLPKKERAFQIGNNLGKLWRAWTGQEQQGERPCRPGTQGRQ